ncbi:MAG: hypothetical protein QM610_01485 [Chitinophagaceae bacterium]
MRIPKSQLVQTLIIANNDRYPHYKTLFRYRLQNALTQGMDIFQEGVIAIAHFWLVLLVAEGGIALWKTYRWKGKIAKG